MNSGNGCFPFRACLECLQGPSLSVTQSYAQLREEMALVKLDRSYMGQNVVLLKEDMRICGSGAALGTIPILQNKAFFEVNIQQSGIWGIGLGTRKADLNIVPVTKGAWVLREDGTFWADGEIVGNLEQPIAEGETIGIAFDHMELKFFKGNELLPISISNPRSSARGEQSSYSLFPLLYVDDNAILDVRFREFTLKLPLDYDEIMIEQTLV